MEFPKEARCVYCEYFLALEPLGSHGLCMLASSLGNGAMTALKTLAIASNSVAARGWLNVSGAYGCVQFEVKK